MTIRTLKFLLTFAVFSLVLNDVARMAFPRVFQSVLAQRIPTDGEKQDDSNPTTTLFEEEAKHKTIKEQFEYPSFAPLEEMNVAIVHLITDDVVRHLAFLPVFSPPPDVA